MSSKTKPITFPYLFKLTKNIQKCLYNFLKQKKRQKVATEKQNQHIKRKEVSEEHIVQFHERKRSNAACQV